MKLLQIRFVEAGASGSTAAKKNTRKENYRQREISEVLEEVQIGQRPSSLLSMLNSGRESNHVESTKRVSLRKLIKLGTIIPPKHNVVTIEVNALM